MWEHWVWEVYTECHQSVREQHVPQHNEHNAKQPMDATPVGNVDRLDNRSIEEDGRDRPDTEGTESDCPSGRGSARESEQIRGIQHRTGKKRMDGAKTDNTWAVDVSVNSRRKPRCDALYAGYSNIASTPSDDVPNPCQHNEPSYRKTDNASQEASHRCQLISGDKDDASERAEDSSKNCVRRRSPDVEQEVLANLVGREMTGTSVVGCRRSAVRLRRHLLRVHRHKWTAHPDTVCAAQHADEDEEHDVNPEERLDHSRSRLRIGLCRLVCLSNETGQIPRTRYHWLTRGRARLGTPQSSGV